VVEKRQQGAVSLLLEQQRVHRVPHEVAHRRLLTPLGKALLVTALEELRRPNKPYEKVTN
jgi:hypothetical protein